MNQLAILENDVEFSRKLLNYIIGHNKRLRLMNLSIKVEEIVEILDLLDEKDILLLDLSFPRINIDKLVTILNQKRNHMPNIIVIEDNLNQCKKLDNLVYTSVKKTYSFNKIINTINKIANMADEQFYERIVKEELSKFEINITTLGYDYIVEGIILALENQTLLKDLQNGLYETLAKKNNQPCNYNIKWAVEKCIKATIKYTNSNITKPYFHVETTEKITPKLFISMIVYNLKDRMEQEMDA